MKPKKCIPCNQIMKSLPIFIDEVFKKCISQEIYLCLSISISIYIYIYSKLIVQIIAGINARRFKLNITRDKMDCLRRQDIGLLVLHIVYS